MSRLISTCKKFYQIGKCEKMGLVWKNLCKKGFNHDLEKHSLPSAINTYKSIFFGHCLPTGKYLTPKTLFLIENIEHLLTFVNTLYVGIILVCNLNDEKFNCTRTIFLSENRQFHYTGTFILELESLIFKLKHVKITGYRHKNLYYYFPPSSKNHAKRILSEFIPNIPF